MLKTRAPFVAAKSGTNGERFRMRGHKRRQSASDASHSRRVQDNAAMVE
jgi:hypothetical protein